MTPPLYPYLEDTKLTSELLMAFKRLLPKLTEKREIKKVTAEMKVIEEWMKQSRNN